VFCSIPCLFVCLRMRMSTSKQYANVYVQSIFIGPRSIAGVPSSQALLGFHITAPPPVLVLAVLGALAVWIKNQKKNKGSTRCLKNKKCENEELLVCYGCVLPKKKMCVVFYSSFICISAYANVYFKTTLQECLRAGLPPGFPNTAPSPVRVSAVLGTIAVRIPNQKNEIRPFRVTIWKITF